MYRAKFSPDRALLVSLMVWIESILLAMIYFIVGFNIFRFVFANTAVAVTLAVLPLYGRKNSSSIRLRFQVRQWDDLHDSSEENLAKKQATKKEKKITRKPWSLYWCYF